MVAVYIKLISEKNIYYYEEAKLNCSLLRHEFPLVALAFVDCLRAFSFNAPAVICHHMSVPSPLVTLFHGLEVLMESLSLFVAYSF